MQPSSAIAQSSSTIYVRRRWPKYLLWGLMGCATVVIWIFIEIPLLMLPPEVAFLRSVPLLILLHALGGAIASISGPLQFSSRLRGRWPKFHRLVGRFYVSAVFVAAPIAILIAASHRDFDAFSFVITTAIQSAAWAIPTGAAFVAARNRRFQSHRIWMIRSYAVTFTFVFLRLLRFIPAWNHLGRNRTNVAVVLVTLIALAVPEIASFVKSRSATAFRRTALG